LHSGILRLFGRIKGKTHIIALSLTFVYKGSNEKGKNKTTGDQTVKWGEGEGVDLQIVLVKKLTRLAFLA